MVLFKQERQAAVQFKFRDITKQSIRWRSKTGLVQKVRFCVNEKTPKYDTVHAWKHSKFVRPFDPILVSMFICQECCDLSNRFKKTEAPMRLKASNKMKATNVFNTIKYALQSVVPRYISNGVQCDQIGRFLKVLRGKFSNNSGQNIWQLLQLFWNMQLFKKNNFGYFWGNFRKNGATFYCNSWSHWWLMASFIAIIM